MALKIKEGLVSLVHLLGDIVKALIGSLAEFSMNILIKLTKKSPWKRSKIQGVSYNTLGLSNKKYMFWLMKVDTRFTDPSVTKAMEETCLIYLQKGHYKYFSMILYYMRY